jgi:hypothetical protein
LTFSKVGFDGIPTAFAAYSVFDFSAVISIITNGERTSNDANTRNR